MNPDFSLKNKKASLQKLKHGTEKNEKIIIISSKSILNFQVQNFFFG